MEVSLVPLLVLLLMAWASGALVTRYGYPAILGEIGVGILLGPPMLGWIEPSRDMAVLAQVGVFLLMLYVGLEMNPGDLLRSSKRAFYSALGGFLVPFLLVDLALLQLGVHREEAFLVSAAVGATSLAVKSRILIDLKLLDTRLAHVMMGGALIADPAALLVFSAVMDLADSPTDRGLALVIFIGKAIAFFGFSLLTGLYLLPALGKKLKRWGISERTTVFTLVLLVGLVFAAAAEMAGLHAILGAFLAGISLREGVFASRISREVRGLVHDLSLGFLTPVFFVTAGFEFSFTVFQTHLPVLIVVLVLGTIGKLAGTLVFYLRKGENWREGLAVALGMNSHGAVEIVLCGVALQQGVLSRELFSAIVFLSLFSTATTPPLLRLCARWLRQRGELLPSNQGRSGVLIVGAGPLARWLAVHLKRMSAVKMIDTNPQFCEDARREGIEVVSGSALREEDLREAGASEAHTFLAMTRNAQVNVLASRLADEAFGVPDCRVFLGDVPTDILQSVLAGVPGTALFSHGVRMTDWDFWIQRKEVQEEVIPIEEAQTAETFLARLSTGTSAIPLTNRTRDGLRVFDSSADLRVGDRITVLRRVERAEESIDAFDQLVTRSEIVDLARPLSLPMFFQQIAKHLEERLPFSAEEIVKRLMDREIQSSTILSPGLAVPHLLVEGEDQFQMIIARCKGGVAFFGERESRVHMLFVMVGTQNQRNQHLRALGAIAHIAQDPSFEQRWLDAAGPAELRALILSTKRPRF